MFNLTFTGIGSAFNPTLYNTSCYYKEGNKLLLIDCGSDTYRRLCESNVLDGITDIYVCITHTHQDHIGSLGTLIADCSIVNNRNITLVLDPDKEYRNQIFTTLLYAGVKKDIDYKVRKDLKHVFDAIDNVTFYTVSHCDSLISKAYIFYLSSHEIIIYSGDSNDIEKVLDMCHDLGYYKFKQAYIDCNLDKISKYKNSKPHELLAELIKAIPNDKRHLFTVIHYDSNKCRTIAKRNGFNVAYHFTEFEYYI